MSEYQKTYRIKYEVHCKLQNFFNKEIIIKKCLSELHAKAKLDDYCKKKYTEYQYIKVIKCTEENDFMSMFNDILNGRKNKKK